MNLQPGLNKRHPGHKINPNPLPIFHLILLIILNAPLPVHNLDHETDLAALLAALIKHLEVVGDKEVLGFYVDLPVIQRL